VDFLEKPDPKDTPARSACPCFYYLQPAAFPLLQAFLEEKQKEGAVLTDIDATGKWIGWLIHQIPVYSTDISGRLDIGGLKSLIEAEQYLSSQ
jgi:glucose-1-phosphate thymidylyltransferase